VAALDWAIAPRLVAALRRAHFVYICGNGGSAANAVHLNLHLKECRILSFDMLGDSVWVSAYSNDNSYERTIRDFLHWCAKPSDVLVAISGSGDSVNIILALTEARRLKMTTIGLLGMGGGGALSLCDLACVVASDDYGVVEDGHSAVIHVIKKLLAARSGDSKLQRHQAGAEDVRPDAKRRKRPHAAGTRKTAAARVQPQVGAISGAEGGHEQVEAAAPGGER